MKNQNIIYRLKKKYLNLKISTKITLFYTILVFIIFVLGTFLYQTIYMREVSEKVQEVSIQTLYSINSNINYNMATINNYSKLIISDDSVNELLVSSENYKSLEYYKDSYQMKNIYDSINAYNKFLWLIDSYPYVSSVYIVDNRRIVHSVDTVSNKELKDISFESWYNEVVDKKGGYILRFNPNIFLKRDDETFVSLIREIRNIETPKVTRGVLILNISNDVFLDSYKGASNNTIIYIVDEMNRTIVSNVPGSDPNLNYFVDRKDKLLADSKDKYAFSVIGRIGGIDYVQSYLRDNNTGLKIISFSSVDELSGESHKTNYVLLGMIIISSVILLIGAVLITNLITNPIKKLIHSMRGIEKKKFELVNLDDRRDEIGILGQGYNTMIKEIRDLLDKTIKEQNIKRKIELNALQEQVKPHFLYNTLDAMGYLALIGKNDELYEALGAMGSYYRTSLSKGREVVTIEEEIEIVKSYMVLQNLRYGNIVTMVYDIDEKLNEYQILKMVLQPLVENAIYHGIKPKGEPGEIEVSVKLDGEKLIITVKDDGVGISEDDLYYLNKEKIHSNSLSFGLKGTIQRLRIFYGDQGIYSIESKKRYGTKIIIKIPARKGQL